MCGVTLLSSESLVAIIDSFFPGFTSGAPALRSNIYQDVGEPTCFSFSTTGMYAGVTFLLAGIAMSS